MKGQGTIVTRRSTAREQHKNRKSLAMQIALTDSDKLVLAGNQAYTTDRYGQVTPDGDGYVIVVKGRRHAIAFEPNRTTIYTAPLTSEVTDEI